MYDFRIAMISQAAAQIVRRLGAVDGRFLVHALWEACAANREDAQAGLNMAVSDGYLVVDADGCFVLGPNAFVPMFE